MKRFVASLVTIAFFAFPSVAHGQPPSLLDPQRITSFGLDDQSGVFSNDLRNYVSLPGHAVFAGNGIGQAEALHVFNYSNDSVYRYVPEGPELQNFRQLVKVTDTSVAYAHINTATVAPAIFDVVTKELRIADAYMYRLSRSNIYEQRLMASGSGKVFFPAWDETHGEELWMFDGENTSMVFDSRVGSDSSSPRNFTADDQYVYYYSMDDSGQYELSWFDHTLTSPSLSDLNRTNLDLGSESNAADTMGIQAFEFAGEKFLAISPGNQLRTLRVSNAAVAVVDFFDSTPSAGFFAPVRITGDYLYAAPDYPATSLALYKLALSGDQLQASLQQTVFSGSNVNQRLLSPGDISAASDRLSYISRTSGDWELNFIQALGDSGISQLNFSTTSTLLGESSASLNGQAFDITDSDPPNYYLNAGVLPGPRNLVVSQPTNDDVVIYELGGAGQDTLTEITRLETPGSGWISAARFGNLDGTPLTTMFIEGVDRRDIYKLTPTGLEPLGFAQAQADAGLIERPQNFIANFPGGFYFGADDEISGSRLWKYDQGQFTKIDFETGFEYGQDDANDIISVTNFQTGAVVGDELYFPVLDGNINYRLWKVNAQGKMERVSTNGFDTVDIDDFDLHGFGDYLILNNPTSGEQVLVYDGINAPAQVSFEDPSEQLHIEQIEMLNNRVFAFASGDITHRVFEIVDFDSSPRLITAAEFPSLSASSQAAANIGVINNTGDVLQVAIHDEDAINEALIYDFDGQNLVLNDFLTNTKGSLTALYSATEYTKNKYAYGVLASSNNGHVVYEIIADPLRAQAGNAFFSANSEMEVFVQGQKLTHLLTDLSYSNLLGMDDHGVYTLATDYESGIQIYFHEFDLVAAEAPAFSAAPGFAGPVFESVDGIRVLGERLELVENLYLESAEVEFELVEGELVLDVSSFASGEYSLSAKWQGGEVATDLVVIVSNEPKFWTKQISPTEIKLYAKNIVGTGKVQFFHNGNEIAWVNAQDDSDEKLRVITSGRMTGANYLVRTREMVEGKNVFEVYVDGERVLRRAQGN